MRKVWRRRVRRFDRPKDIESAVCERLLNNVWRLDWDENNRVVPPAPYTNHWRNLILSASDSELCLHNSEMAVTLVSTLHQGVDKDITSLRDQIRGHYPNKITQSTITPDQATKALGFAIRLWLHIYPKLEGQQTLPSQTLRQMIEQNIPSKASTTSIQGRLPDDFCAKHLWRRRGIRIQWTDDINEHLTMHLQERLLLVFRHTNMLSKMQENPMSDPFPPTFTAETLQTLHLLFRPTHAPKAHWLESRLEKTRDADLELKMLRSTQFDLATYPYYAERLSVINEAYGKRNPGTLRQWWFDRRDRVQWATFWVAFLVLVLTIVFGVVQCVAGVVSAWASVKALGK